MTELKACPFCGHGDIGVHKERDLGNGRYQFFAECAYCSATVWGDYKDTMAKAYDSAMEAWNRRDGERHAD